MITEVLEKRKTAGRGAATLDEIFDELVRAGCEFTGKNDAIKTRGLAIAMGKNQKFCKLPNETWGLEAWYPGIKVAKKFVSQGKTEEEEENPIKEQ